jgi:hypothetical protein
MTDEVAVALFLPGQGRRVLFRRRKDVVQTAEGMSGQVAIRQYAVCSSTIFTSASSGQPPMLVFLPVGVAYVLSFLEVLARSMLPRDNACQ